MYKTSMFMRQCSQRTAATLCSFRQATRAMMPLRAKILNPAFLGQKNNMTTMAAPKPLPTDDPDDVLFNALYGVRTIELNRPDKLNSLNTSMARKIIPRIQEWEKSQIANIIIMGGVGLRAFCSGGDVAALAKQNAKGESGIEESKAFFAVEYQLDHLLATSTKPIVVYLDGITMGGGVGLSVHTPFRIATENTLFAMPETSIGFFPDVGGGFFLSRLDGQLGVYLGLTSERLKGVQAFYAGIATHYLPSTSLAILSHRLAELTFPDYMPMNERLPIINDTILEYCSGFPPHEPPVLVGDLRIAIDYVFSQPTIANIISTLKSISNDISKTVLKDLVSPSADLSKISTWASKTLETLLERSPTSLAITLKQLRLGSSWSIAETFQREHLLASKFMHHPDFVEGVSARLISKPSRKPVWNPALVSEISEEQVEEWFRVPAGQEKLKLLRTHSPEYHYTDYPYTWIGLPSETEILTHVQKGGKSKREILQWATRKWAEGGLEGKQVLRGAVKSKVEDVLTRKCVVKNDEFRLRA